MSHIHGLLVGCLAPLACQSVVAIGAQDSSPQQIWDMCTKNREVLDTYDETYPKEKPPALRFIRTTSGTLAPEIAAEAERKLQCALIEAYGLTEAAHQICSNGYPTLEDRKFGSVGKPTGTEVAILDSQDPRKCCRIGDVGEIWIRGWNVVEAYENIPLASQGEEFLSHNEIKWDCSGTPAYFSSAFDLSLGPHRSFASLKSLSRRPSIEPATIPPELIPPSDTETEKEKKPTIALMRFSSALEPYVASEFPQRREPLISPLPLPIRWLRTGDTGKMDAEGYLSLIARSKDIINRGGLKLSPKEVEDVFATMPEVESCAVFALKHATLGEAVHIAIVLAPGVMMTTQLERDMLKRSTSRLAYFKVPEKIHVVKHLPIDTSGRVNRDHLSQEFGHPPPTPSPRTPMSPSTYQLLITRG